MTLFDVSCFGKRRERHESLNNEPAQAENVEIRDRRSGEGVTERESEGGTEGAGTLAARNALPQESRTAGILTGEGTNKNLAVRYMQRDTKAKPGEILITSGLDGKYPKGIPVARVISVAPSNYTEFMTIYAEPLVDMQHIEEVMLLEPTGIVKPPMVDTPDPVFVGPPLPSPLLPKQKDASSSREQPAQGHQRGF